MHSSTDQFSSRTSGSDGLQYSPLSGQAVELAPDQFLAQVFRPGVASDDFEALVSRAHPAYTTFLKSLTGSTEGLSDTVLALLNTMNRGYEAHFGLKKHDQCMRFINIVKTKLSEHPDDEESSVKPPLVTASHRIVKSWTKACETSLTYPTLAFHRVVAGVFVRDEAFLDDRSVQFVWSLLRARPDLVGTVIVLITRRNCEFVYADPASAYTSGSLRWDEATLAQLVGFIHRVHSPFTDPTVRLEHQPPQSKPTKPNIRRCLRPIHSREPVWLVQGMMRREYRVTKVLAVGQPLFSGNWVGAATQCRNLDEPPSRFKDCPRVVIKDFWCIVAKEASAEDVIIKHVHAEGQLPGVCDLVDSFVVPIGSGVLRTSHVDQRIPLKRKHRIIMDGTSTDIYRCHSVLEFFMIAYDALEVLKTLHERRQVLYRDVSLGNIRRRVGGGADDQPERCIGTTFVGDMLAYKYTDSRLRKGPTCTVIDFDHAFSAQHMDISRLKCAVGTPPFVARAVVQEFRLLDPSPPPIFPKLYGSAKGCYIVAHGHTAYTSHSVSRSSYSTPRPIPLERRLGQPIHDAESCFWLIVYFLATAMPASAVDEDDTSIGDHVCRTMEATEFKTPDGRSAFFEQSSIWTQCLHPDLQDFGDLLSELAEQVRPSYDSWGQVEDKYHLHHAMQRILMQEICRILDDDLDVQLDTTFRRRVGTVGPFPSVEPQGKKRHGESLDLPPARRVRIASKDV